jgi:hypothetical protein
MAHASNTLENLLVDHLFRAATFAKPAALHVALFTAAPSDAGGGTEVAGGGYARVATPPGDATWTATQGGISGASSGTGGATSNAAAVTFPTPTADWGTVTHVGIFTAATGGTLLVWAPLTAARAILNGDPAPRFPAGAFVITVA